MSMTNRDTETHHVDNVIHSIKMGALICKMVIENVFSIYTLKFTIITIGFTGDGTNPHLGFKWVIDFETFK